MSEIAAIVLAAGRSSRMEGGNKLLLPWKSSTIVAQVIDSVKDAGFKKLIVVTNPVTHEYIASLGVGTVENTRYQEGMTTSIQAGVLAAGKVDGYMICPGDLPHITPEEYESVGKAFLNALNQDAMAIALPVFNGQKGHPVIFSGVYMDEILAHSEMEGCSGIIKSHSDHVVQVQMMTDHVLRDIDTKEDYSSQ